MIRQNSKTNIQMSIKYCTSIENQNMYMAVGFHVILPYIVGLMDADLNEFTSS